MYYSSLNDILIHDKPHQNADRLDEDIEEEEM